MGKRKKLRGLITIIRNLTVSWEGDCGGIDCDLYKRLRPPPHSFMETSLFLRTRMELVRILDYTIVQSRI